MHRLMYASVIVCVLTLASCHVPGFTDSHKIDVAEYSFCELRGTGGQFSELSMGSIEEPDQLQQRAKSVWLKLPTGKTIEAKALTEEDAVSLAEDRFEKERRGKEFVIYKDLVGEYSFWFCEGTLCSAIISSKAVGFSASSDGRFLYLPVSKSEMLKEFGEPHWRKATINAL